MRKFIVIFVLGFVLGSVVSTVSQVEAPITYRVPTIASDSTWTPKQRADLMNQWARFVADANVNTRTIFDFAR